MSEFTRQKVSYIWERENMGTWIWSRKPDYKLDVFRRWSHSVTCHVRVVQRLRHLFPPRQSPGIIPCFTNQTNKLVFVGQTCLCKRPSVSVAMKTRQVEKVWFWESSLNLKCPGLCCFVNSVSNLPNFTTLGKNRVTSPFSSRPLPAVGGNKRSFWKRTVRTWTLFVSRLSF